MTIVTLKRKKGKTPILAFSFTLNITELTCIRKFIFCPISQQNIFQIFVLANARQYFGCFWRLAVSFAFKLRNGCHFYQVSILLLNH